MPRTRRTYTPEFKTEAVRLVTEQGYSVAEAARSLGLSDNLIRNWKQALEAQGEHAFPGHGKLSPFEEENRRGFGYAQAYNLTGWPTATVRVGTSPEGLPLGVQVAARPWREDVALALVQHLEHTFGGWKMPTAI